jgi:predicted ATPase/class 3 adenylate cyclase
MMTTTDPPNRSFVESVGKTHSPSLPTGTVTFLFSDIEGSTPLWEQHPEQMAVALQIHNAALRVAIEANGGAVFKIVGDSFQAAFATAPLALKAAIAGQKALQSASWNELGPLKVRMGLHTGEAELDPAGDEYAVSHTKNRAARIMSAAHGGQILFSQETKELVDHRLPEGVSLNDLGEHRLKGMSFPERLFQVCAPDLPQKFPLLATTIVHPNNLPVQLTSFIGREKEIAAVCSLLSTHRLVTLTGSGGTGKTRLSFQVAGQVLENYPNGAWLVELAPLSDPDLIPKTVASALSLPEIPGKTIIDSLVDYLRTKRLLLILDNCEHLLEACADLADRLLRACPGLTILASSREFLGVEGEAPYRVPPMALPDSRQLPSLEALSEFDAVRLFVERARVVSPGFTITEKNASAVAQVVARLDGIPLAIELAASRLHLLGIDQLLQRLNDAFRLLTGGSRSKLPRHQTLRACIDWSYHLLSEPERTLLRRLSVFAGGWTLEAAEQVCAYDFEDCQPLCPDDILELISGLVNKSLILTVSEADGLNRFKMLETIRQYAGEKLADEFFTNEKLVDEKEASAVRSRHLDYYLAWAESLEPKIRSREQIETLDSIDGELDNLRLALEWGLQTDVDKELRLAAAMMWFWHIRTRHSEGTDWLERGLADVLSRLGEPGFESQCSIVHAKALGALGFTYLMDFVYHHDAALGLLKVKNTLTASLSIYRQVGSEQLPGFEAAVQRGTAWALLWLGECQRFENALDQAGQNAQEALNIFHRLGDAHGMAESLQTIARMVKDSGQRKKIYQEQLAIDQANGDIEGIATALQFIGIMDFIDALYEPALSALKKSLEHYQQVKNLEMVSYILLWMGISALCKGDLPRADLYFTQSLTICLDLGNDSSLTIRLFFKMFTIISKGEFELAARMNAETWEIAQRIGNHTRAYETGFWSARLARLQGDLPRARQHAEEILDIASIPNNLRMLAKLELGHLALADGDPALAGRLWREGIQLLKDISEITWFQSPFEALAHLAAQQQQYERAACMFGARWSRGAQNLLSPTERAGRKIELDEARKALGDERFEQLYAEGQRLTFEQALALALQEDP